MRRSDMNNGNDNRITVFGKSFAKAFGVSYVAARALNAAFDVDGSSEAEQKRAEQIQAQMRAEAEQAKREEAQKAREAQEAAKREAEARKTKSEHPRIASTSKGSKLRDKPTGLPHKSDIKSNESDPRLEQYGGDIAKFAADFEAHLKSSGPIFGK